MKSAREYWKDRFGEYPQTDADRLAVVMMMEYYHDVTKDEELVNKISSNPVLSSSLPCANGQHEIDEGSRVCKHCGVTYMHGNGR